MSSAAHLPRPLSKRILKQINKWQEKHPEQRTGYFRDLLSNQDNATLSELTRHELDRQHPRGATTRRLRELGLME